MTMLYNVSSNRLLREGDVVRVAAGSRKGRLGKVVGIDLMSHTPLVVQYPRAVSGVLRESFSANDVELHKASWTDVGLSPTPTLIDMLAEGGLSGSYHTCGAFLCMSMKESGDTLTFIPKQGGDNLKEVFDTSDNLEVGVRSLLEHSFVTRLPDLIDIGLSQVEESLKLNSPQVSADFLLGGNRVVDN